MIKIFKDITATAACVLGIGSVVCYIVTAVFGAGSMPDIRAVFSLFVSYFAYLWQGAGDFSTYCIAGFLSVIVFAVIASVMFSAYKTFREPRVSESVILIIITAIDSAVYFLALRASSEGSAILISALVFRILLITSAAFLVYAVRKEERVF